MDCDPNTSGSVSTVNSDDSPILETSVTTLSGVQNPFVPSLLVTPEADIDSNTSYSTTIIKQSDSEVDEILTHLPSAPNFVDSCNPQDPDILTADLDEVQRALTHFDYFGGDEQLDQAIAKCSRALELSSVISSPTQLSPWNILQATGLYLRFERDGRAEDIDAAKETFEGVIASCSHNSSLLVHALYGLGRVYNALHMEHDSLDAARTAHEYFREAMTVAAEVTIVSNITSDEIAVHLCRNMGLPRTV